MTASLLATQLDTVLLRPDLAPRPHLLDRLQAGLWAPDGFLRRQLVPQKPFLSTLVDRSFDTGGMPCRLISLP